MQWNRRFIFLIVCFYSYQIAAAPNLDSLRLVLHNAKEDTAKVNLYNTLALQIYQTEEDSAMYYVANAVTMAKRLAYGEGEARSNYVKGRILLEQARNKECITYLKEALAIYDRLDGVEKFVGDTRLSLGRAYDMTGDYFNSLDQFQKGIDTYEEINEAKGMANCLVNIGIIHDRMKDHEKSLKYYRDAEAQYKKIDDSKGLVYIYNNIGYIDFQLKNYQGAKENYLLGIDLAEKIEFEYMLPFLYNNLGGLYLELDEMTKSESTYRKANVISVKMKNRDGIVHSEMALAHMNYKKKNYDGYLESILTGYEEAKAQGNKNLIQQTSKLLSEMYEFKGNKFKAYDYLIESYAMQDSLNSSSLIQETSGLETQYQLEIRNREEQRKLESKDRQSLFGLFLFLSILGLLGGFLLLKNRQNKAKDLLNTELRKKNAMLLDAEQKLESRNKDLEKYIESNIQLEQFAHFASHDLKSPLRTIASFTGLLKQNIKEETNEKIKTYIHAIEVGTKRMNALVVDLLDYSKVNSQMLNVENFIFSDLISEVKQNLSYAIQSSTVKISTQGDDIEIEADRNKIKQVIENLLSNAIKFSSSNGQAEIDIIVKERQEDYLVAINDNGIGIEKKYHESIFEAFKQLHAKRKYEGSGLGLAICKNVIEKHGGKIWLSSEPEKGTSMRFSIPKIS